MLVVNCILNKILNFELHVELVNPAINVGLHSFVESGIDLWNSPMIKSIINFVKSQSPRVIQNFIELNTSRD